MDVSIATAVLVGNVVSQPIAQYARLVMLCRSIAVDTLVPDVANAAGEIVNVSGATREAPYTMAVAGTVVVTVSADGMA